MFEFLKSDKNKENDKKKQIFNQKIENLNKPLNEIKLNTSLDENIETIKELFKDVDTLKMKYIDNKFNKNLRFCIVYSDGMVNSSIMDESIIKPLMLSSDITPAKDLLYTLMNCVVQINEMDKTGDVKEIVQGITNGDTVLFVDGEEETIVLNSKHFMMRSIKEPDNEKTLNGPREGFNESMLVNLSLIRRKVHTNELKMKYYKLGKRTQTPICVCYIDGIADKKLINKLFKKLDSIDIDAVLDSNYITELIRDNPRSPFRTTGYTERPDVVIGKLLEGRIAIFVDGSPDVLTVPYLFVENFQSSEDYYLNYYYTSFSRILRMLGFFLTIFVPGFYIAIAAFHQEMMPTSLLISLAIERQSVPLPASIECFIMLIVFDILKETGVRMPTNVGQAMSIVGALVIGQAAVAAKLVAAPMIIVVAITGITNLLVPKMNAPIIYIRLGLLFAASVFGFFGLVLGLCGIVIHILNLKSLGTPQIMLSGEFRFQENKDIMFRAPWWKMILRTKQISMDRVRMKERAADEDD